MKGGVVLRNIIKEKLEELNKYKTKKPPLSPTKIFLEVYGDAHKKKKSEVYNALKINRMAYYRLIREFKLTTSQEMLTRFAVTTGTEIETWFELQKIYDVYHAKRNFKKEIKETELLPSLK